MTHEFAVGDTGKELLISTAKQSQLRIEDYNGNTLSEGSAGIRQNLRAHRADYLRVISDEAIIYQGDWPPASAQVIQQQDNDLIETIYHQALGLLAHGDRAAAINKIRYNNIAHPLRAMLAHSYWSGDKSFALSVLQREPAHLESLCVAELFGDTLAISHKSRLLAGDNALGAYALAFINEITKGIPAK